MTAWILVSDSGGARIFSALLGEDNWSLVQDFKHPEGREMSKDIRPSSPPGRMQQSKAPGGRRTAMEPRTSPKEAEAERFAEHLANYLEDATARREFDSLVLVAPPHFLGMLRGALRRQTAHHLRATVDKDLSSLGVHELRERLADIVFPPG